MELRFLDIHSHLNLSPLSDNVEGIVTRLRQNSIGTITVGTGLETSRQAVTLANQYPDVLWATIGIHPTDAIGEELSQEFVELARDAKVVAIGETGLDYFRDQSEELKKTQKELFEKHIELAQAVGRPLMLHVRASKGTDDAYYDALGILAGKGVRANFHFFSGSRECMEAIVAAGFTISVDGPITFAREYDEMLRAVPMDRIMVETDAPFAAPVPYRGKTCEPWMVVEVAKALADIRQEDPETVRIQLLKNSQEFFGIK